MDYVKDALRMAGEAVSGAVRDVADTLGPLGGGSRRPRVMSPKQQLERFLSMNREQLSALQQRHGEQSFNRYLIRMRRLAREV